MDEATTELALPLAARAEEVKFGTLALLTPCQTLSQIKTIICGQSHAWSIAQATVATGGGGRLSPGPGLAREFGFAGLWLTARSTEEWLPGHAAHLAKGRNLALVWRGNQHNTDFLFAASPIFDFIASADPECGVEEGAVLVPEAALRAHFKPTVTQLEGVFNAGQTSSGRRRFVLGTPPPLYDGRVILDRLSRERALLDRAAKLGLDVNELRVTPAAIRRKMWVVLQQMMRESADRVGAEFIASPPQVQDEHGFLDLRYSAGDVTHATVEYGAMMLQRLADRLTANPADLGTDAQITI